MADQKSCDLCPKTFENVRGLHIHMRLKHTSPVWKICKSIGFGGEINIGWVRRTLARGEDVNSKDGDNQTGLIYAVSHRWNNEIVKLLLEQPSLDLNCVNNKGNTALLWATINDNVEGVRLLLADPRLNTINHKGLDGRTPVMKAMIGPIKGWWSTEVLEELVAHPSVDLDTRDAEGRSLEDAAK